MRASNLRNLFHRVGTPEVIRNCEPMLKRLVNPEVRNTLVTDILSLSQEVHNDEEWVEDFAAQTNCPATPLPEALEACLLESFDQSLAATVLSHIVINGLTYSSSWKHLGNSSILLDSGSPNKYSPACIDYITQVDFEDNDAPCTVTYIAARKYKPANVRVDPFTSFPLLQAQLWSQKLGALQLFRLSDIRSHFAYLPIHREEKDLMVIISLSRVRLPLLLYSTVS